MFEDCKKRVNLDKRNCEMKINSFLILGKTNKLSIMCVIESIVKILEDASLSISKKELIDV